MGFSAEEASVALKSKAVKPVESNRESYIYRDRSRPYRAIKQEIYLFYRSCSRYLNRFEHCDSSGPWVIPFPLANGDFT